MTANPWPTGRTYTAVDLGQPGGDMTAEIVCKKTKDGKVKILSVKRYKPTGRISGPDTTFSTIALVYILCLIAFFGPWLIPEGMRREAHREAVAHRIECQQYHHKGCK